MILRDFFTEAANPAQQAAIAIAMKKAHKKPRTEGLNEFAPGGNSASSYYAVTANFVNEFAQQKQEELQDLIDAGWTKQDLAQAGTLQSHASDIAHFEQVRDGFLKGLKPGFDAYNHGDTQLKDQLGEYWLENDLPLSQDWEKMYGEPWGRDEYDEGAAEEQLDELKCWPGYTRVQGVPAGAPGSCKKKTSEDIAEEQCPECGGPMFSDLLLAEKQDACYHKVKSRYKVWPSAYASGALVQCRKKGAANWGNKSK